MTVGPAARPIPQWIYAIGSPEHPMVKIGITTSVRARLYSLQTASPFPLQVLWQHEGGRFLEEFIHRHLAGCRVRGEWFDLKGAEDPASRLRGIVSLYQSPTLTGIDRAEVGKRTGAFREAKAEREALRKELAAAIRQAAADGIPQKDICEETGYTRQQVRRIVLANEPDGESA